MHSVDGEDPLRWRRDGLLRWSPVMTTDRAPDRRFEPRGSDRPAAGRRRGVLAGMLLLVQVMTGCSALGGPPDRLAEAEADARDAVADLVAEVGAQSDDRTRTADQIGRALAASPQADLISISGVDTADPDGVTALLRVVGTGKDGSWLEPEWVSEEFCFELRFAPAPPADPPTVPCPSLAARLTFPPPTEPKLPSPDEVRRALSESSADEAGVWASLATFSLDPAIRVDVAARGGEVGVALRSPVRDSGRYDCVLARVRSETVEAWRPAGVQLQPGELSCRATESLAGHGLQPPK